jgi:sugar phosphate permease
MVRFGAVLAGLGFVLLAFTNSYLTFLLVFLGLLALGISAGFSHPLMALLNQWFAHRRALAITLGSVGTSFGGMILTPLVVLLVLQVGWRQGAIVSGILIATLVLPMTLFIRNTPESMGLRRDGLSAEDQTPSGSLAASGQQIGEGREDFTVKEAMRTKAYWHLVVAMGFRVFSKSALYVHLVPLMVWKGIDEQTAGFLLAFFSISEVPLRIFAAWSGDRWSMTKVPALCAFAGVGAAVVLLLGKEGSVWTVVMFVFLFAMAESGNLPSWALIGHFFGRQYFATIRGTLSLFQSLISLPAPVFAGLVFDRTSSYTLALGPMAGFYLLAGLLYWMLRSPKRPMVG